MSNEPPAKYQWPDNVIPWMFPQFYQDIAIAFTQGMTIKQIADHLNTKESVVRVAINRKLNYGKRKRD